MLLDRKTFKDFRPLPRDNNAFQAQFVSEADVVKCNSIYCEVKHFPDWKPGDCSGQCMQLVDGHGAQHYCNACSHNF